METNGFQNKYCVELNISEINNLKEFITAAIISKLIIHHKRKSKEVERIKGRSKQASNDGFYEISNDYLSKAFRISKSKAYWVKKTQKKLAIYLSKGLIELGVKP